MLHLDLSLLKVLSLNCVAGDVDKESPLPTSCSVSVVGLHFVEGCQLLVHQVVK